MSTLVRRRVSGGTSNELSDPWKGQQASTLLDDSQSYSKGYRLGNSHQRLPMKKRSAGAPTLIIALIVMVGLSTWFAVQHWHVFGSSPKKNWIFSEFTELELLLEDSGKKVHAYDDAFVVFVSISNGESTRVERGSSQVSTVEAFQMALDLHGTKQGVFNDHHWIKVDVVDHVETIENFDVSKKLDEQIHSRGWFHGIALDWESGWTFLPEEVWAQNMIDAQTNKVRWDSIVACVLERKRVGSQDSVDWSSFSKTRDLETSSLPKGLNLFHTSSFFLDASSLSIKSPFGSEVLPLYHGHRLFEKDDITPERLMQAAIYAGDYLTRSIQPEDNGKFPRGRMTYQYNPRNDHETDAYNLSCQAGSLFAMSCLLHDHKDANLLHGIRMGLDFIINQNLKECHILEDDQPMVTKCVVENVRDEQGVESHVAKLGPNALTLLAISEFVAASRELGMLSKDQLDRYIGIARGLADYIRSTQHDDGSFIQKIQIWPTVEVDEEFYVRFYQGEAAFAMSRFYFVSGLVGREQDTEWLEVAESAAHYVTATEVEVPDTEFFDDPWLMNGLAELHRCGRRLGTRLIDYAIRTARVIAENQYTEDSESTHQLDHLDWLGIPDASSSSATSAATKSQGLCAVYELALEYRYHKLEAHWIRDTIINSVRYQLKAQYGPELAMYMKDQARILGGMRKGVDSLYMRNDYTQHSLSSFLCLSKLLEKDLQ